MVVLIPVANHTIWRYRHTFALHTERKYQHQRYHLLQPVLSQSHSSLWLSSECWNRRKQKRVSSFSFISTESNKRV